MDTLLQDVRHAFRAMRRSPAFSVAAIAVGANLAPDLWRPAADGQWRLVSWAMRYLAPMGETDRDPGEWASAINFNHSVAGVMLRWSTAKLVRAEDFEGRMVISSDPDEHRAYIQRFVDLGFDRVYLHNVGRNQAEWIEVFGRDVLPKLHR